mmetsp:Transcript_12303/g.29460  ORF Transcript_12303/g.29460 Transcript_12303/m.29460 type:complete len:310 (-) Transcript_12303:2015-2944(-)
MSGASAAAAGSATWPPTWSAVQQEVVSALCPSKGDCPLAFIAKRYCEESDWHVASSHPLVYCDALENLLLMSFWTEYCLVFAIGLMVAALLLYMVPTPPSPPAGPLTIHKDDTPREERTTHASASASLSASASATEPSAAQGSVPVLAFSTYLVVLALYCAAGLASLMALICYAQCNGLWDIIDFRQIDPQRLLIPTEWDRQRSSQPYLGSSFYLCLGTSLASLFLPILIHRLGEDTSQQDTSCHTHTLSTHHHHEQQPSHDAIPSIAARQPPEGWASIQQPLLAAGHGGSFCGFSGLAAEAAQLRRDT